MSTLRPPGLRVALNFFLTPPGGALLSTWDVGTQCLIWRYDVHQRVPANLVDPEECGFPLWKKVFGIMPEVLCAKTTAHFFPVEGASLVCESQRGTHRHLCGLYSTGARLAIYGSYNNLIFHVSEYTDVSRYHQWIKKHMQIIWQQYQRG